MRLAKHGADLLYTSRRIYETMTGTGLQVRRQHGVSRAQQLAQIIHYRRRLGAGGSEYYMFELYRPDMSDVARGRFLTQLAWNALSRVLNQPDRKSDDSKLALSRHFAKAGIPTPRTLGYTAFAPTDVHRAAPEFIPLSELGRLIPPNGSCSNAIVRRGAAASWCSNHLTAASSSTSTEDASTFTVWASCCASKAEAFFCKSVSRTIPTWRRSACRVSRPFVF